jgi:hypothetical protein
MTTCFGSVGRCSSQKPLYSAGLSTFFQRGVTVLFLILAFCNLHALCTYDRFGGCLYELVFMVLGLGMIYQSGGGPLGARNQRGMVLLRSEVVQGGVYRNVVLHWDGSWMIGPGTCLWQSENI